MNCPRCNQPTHVLSSRPKGHLVKRTRGCGQRRHGKLSGPTCGLKFLTVEMIAGATTSVTIKVGLEGIEAEVMKR